ncbi:MAG: 7-carboxy-7-deazaguanine synthase QueE, partial [Actinomycetota bacterium]|nr:7-carboxy-7-deazaguanine synthase QueE [Actinomycetota bacterium]
MAQPPGRTATGTLLVAECFGPTLRGEGPSTGQPALFIRLSRCNLSCPGCDSAFTWDWSRFDLATESRRFGLDELVEWAVGAPARLVVITGGEPLLQQDNLVELVARLGEVGQRVEIETNGTIAPSPDLVAVTDLFVVSPK